MIIGHQKIRERLGHSAKKNAAVQTYLFVGPESVGKFQVAKEFAHALIQGEHTAVTKNEMQETDLFILEPEREVEKGVTKEKDIKVEQVREAIRFVETFPYAADKKVLIIRDAHRLTEGAQNALLKTLEEPPAYVVIILVTHELGKILPTTLSRCQQIAFQFVAPQEIEEALRQESAILPEHHRFLLALGRPGLTMQALSHEPAYEQQILLLESLIHLSEKPLRDRLKITETAVANVPQTMQLLMWWAGGLHVQSMQTGYEGGVTLLLCSIEKIERLRRNMKQFSSSARLLLDTFALHW